MSNHSSAIAVQDHAHQRSILAVLCLCLTLVVVNLNSLNVALPNIITELSAGPSAQVWIVSSYALVFACLLLPMGALADRYGRQRILVVGLVLFGTSSVLAAASRTAGALIGARSAMGVGAALIMPATLSIIANVFSVSERPRAIAIWSGVSASSAALGLPIAGLLMRYFGWPAVFLLNIPLALLAVALVAAKVPNTRHSQDRPIDVVGALLGAASLGALLLAIIEGPESGWASRLVVAAFATSVVGMTLFLAWERRIVHPMLELSLFKEPHISAGTLTITTAFMVMFGAFLLLSLYMQLIKDWSPFVSGLATMPFAFMMLLVAPQSPRIVARFGLAWTIGAGQVLQAVGAFSLVLIGPETPYWVFAPSFLLFPIGMGLMLPASTASIMNAVPLDNSGVGSALNDTAREVGGAVGISLLGALLAVGYGRTMASATEYLPAADRELASESVVGAREVANRLSAQYGSQLRGAAETAFTDGLQLAFVVAGSVCLLGAASAALLRRSSTAGVCSCRPDTDVASPGGHEGTMSNTLPAVDVEDRIRAACVALHRVDPSYPPTDAELCALAEVSPEELAIVRSRFHRGKSDGAW